MRTGYKVVTPESSTLIQYFYNIWQKRGLIITLAKRDIKVRFSQTILRVGWALFQPILTTSIFVFFFGYILNWQAGKIPFVLYVLTGVISWNLFTFATIQGSSGFGESSTLIRKVYFPRLVIPISKILVASIEVGTSLFVLAIVMLYYGICPGWKIIFLPFLIILNILFPLSIICLVHSASYRFKDLLHILPLITHFGVWITPVFFTIEILPENLQFIWYINPMSGIVEGWRACLMNSWNFNWHFLPSMLMIIPLFVMGIWVWNRYENSISDYI